MQAWTLAVARHRRSQPLDRAVFSLWAWRASGFRVIARNLIAASGFASVHGLLNSTAFDVARNLALFLVVVFWLGLAVWVYRDARRRIDDGLVVATATLLGLSVPYIGVVIYLLFRPPESLADVRARGLELRALEEQLGQHALHCPVCRLEVDASFLVCPVCTTRLKRPCTGCAAALEPSWQVCPYCGVPELVVTPELGLDAALTAEVSAIGSGKAHGRPKRMRKTG